MMHDALAVSTAVDAPTPARTRMLADVRDGLFRRGQKELPPTYFYDARGSRLFDEITRLEEYYPTRAERALLETHADAIAELTSPRAFAELGAGTAEKSRVLLRAMLARGPVQYLPIDVDGHTLDETARALRRALPALEVAPIVADMRDDVSADGARHPLLYGFLGSTIGNFDTPAAVALLQSIRTSLRPGDRLLVGMDLVKDTRVLEAAYNDGKGVTREFNLNVLRVLNRELGADFPLEAFEHRAIYDEALARIEMHLDVRRDCTVRVPGIGCLELVAGESIRTEISCKYDRASATALLAAGGFQLTEWFVSAAPEFALAVAEPVE